MAYLTAAWPIVCQSVHAIAVFWKIFFSTATQVEMRVLLLCKDTRRAAGQVWNCNNLNCETQLCVTVFVLSIYL